MTKADRTLSIALRTNPSSYHEASELTVGFNVVHIRFQEHQNALLTPNEYRPQRQAMTFVHAHAIVSDAETDIEQRVPLLDAALRCGPPKVHTKEKLSMSSKLPTSTRLSQGHCPMPVASGRGSRLSQIGHELHLSACPVAELSSRRYDLGKCAH